jgi:hypothetical protein
VSLRSPTPIEYEFVLDEAYFRAAHSRGHRVAHAFRWLPAVLIGGSIFLFAGMSAIALADGEWWKVIIPGVPFVAYLLYLRHRSPVDLRGIRKSGELGTRMRVSVCYIGVEVVGVDAQTVYRWPAFVRARADAEGVALTLSRGGLLWLPHAGLARGTAEESIAWFERELGQSRPAART